MATNTTNYGWTKPSYEDAADIEVLNGTIDNIDAQVKTNENNILYNIKDGVQNIFQLASGTRIAGGVTFTINADGTIVLNNTATSDAVFILSETLNVSDDTYVLYGDGLISGVFMETYETGYTNRRTFTSSVATNSNTKIWRLIVSSGTNVNGVTIRPMLCKKSLFDANPSYQPYALSNAAITPALQECVDNGAKNRLPATSTTTSTNNGLTLVVNSDYSITITGTMTTVENTDIYFLGSWTNTSPFANYTGKNMRMYCKSSASIVGKFKMYDRTANKGYAVAINNNEEANISGNLTAAYFTIAATANAINVTLYPMICEPSLYIVSQQYVPPAMSNAELTSAIQALQAQLANQ